MWDITAEPFSGGMEAEAARLEGEVQKDEVLDMSGRRWVGIAKCFWYFKGFVFHIEYFWWQ